MDKVIKPSSKQKKLIKELERLSGDKFTGQSIQDATEYISKHEELISKVDFRESSKPSKKQQDTIDKICNLFGVSFDGTSMKEASLFLEEYLPKYLEYWANKRKGGNK